jgi:hypothetical protein
MIDLILVQSVKAAKAMFAFCGGEGHETPQMFWSPSYAQGSWGRNFSRLCPPVPSSCFPHLCTRQAAQPREYRNASTCMRCMRPGLICRSDFNRPNFRALYTAKASAFRLDAFTTLAMSSQSMPSALRFELNARCSVSLIRPYETKKVALTNLRPLGKQSEGFSSPFASWTS